jgi:hypothetical protein
MANKTLYRKIQDQIRMNLIQMKQLEIEIIKLKTDALEHQLEEMKTKDGKTVHFEEKDTEEPEIKVNEEEKKKIMAERSLPGIPYNLTLGDDYAVGLFPYKKPVKWNEADDEEKELEKLKRLGDNYILPKKITRAQIKEISINAEKRLMDEDEQVPNPIATRAQKQSQDVIELWRDEETDVKKPDPSHAINSVPYNLYNSKEDEYATNNEVLELGNLMKSQDKPIFPCPISSITPAQIKEIHDYDNRNKDVQVFLNY